MENILIIGSQGTLGRYLSRSLNKSFTLHTYDERIQSLEGQINKINNLLHENKITWVINAVGSTNVNRCEVDKDYAFKGNVLVPKVISRLQNDNDFKFGIINFSSDQVYSGLGNSFEHEEDPQNEYGRTKLTGEKFLLKNVCNLRINYVSKGTKRQSFTDWVVNTASKKELVELYSDVYFNPVDLSCLADCTKKVIAERVFGTINIGCKSKISKADFYLQLAKNLSLVNPNAKISTYAKSNIIPRPLDMSMNVSKASELGFKLPSIKAVMINLLKEYK
jgi:dTDP-4-dehydrorhamnose reductase